MTKKEYIRLHGKSQLAKRLACNDWLDSQKIEIVGGLNAPHTKTSNLYKALRRTTTRQYIIGGHRQRGTEGWWMAVMVD